MHRTHPPSRSSSARIGKAQCTDVIYSAVWFTSTGELYERIYAPHTLLGAVLAADVGDAGKIPAVSCGFATVARFANFRPSLTIILTNAGKE
jgi:hypothetical protein